MTAAAPDPQMTPSRHIAVREAWLDQVREEIIEPALPIIDPHHHLWDQPGERYLLDDLLRDTGSGHDVRATVFVQCGAMYRAGGPEEPAAGDGVISGGAERVARHGVALPKNLPPAPP